MDWKKVIAELEAEGLTQEEIAGKCHASQPYISQLKTGKRKRAGFDIGDALRALHKATLRKKSAAEIRA